MKQIKITIKNGKITAEAHGYKGVGCDAPMNAIKAAMGGSVDKEIQTQEAFETEETETVNYQNDLLA